MDNTELIEKIIKGQESFFAENLKKIDEKTLQDLNLYYINSLLVNRWVKEILIPLFIEAIELLEKIKRSKTIPPLGTKEDINLENNLDIKLKNLLEKLEQNNIFSINNKKRNKEDIRI